MVESNATTYYAVSVLKEDGNSGVSGVVKFTQVEGGLVTITAEVKGLAAGKHGFHVHQFGKSYYYFNIKSCHRKPY